MGKLEQQHIEMLQRRSDRLHHLTNNWCGKLGGDSWSRRELAAIEWALSIVSKPEHADAVV